MTIIVDTPDYQRGVVSAQILLAKALIPTPLFPLIQIPPNAETLILAADGADPTIPEVIGQETGIAYAGVKAQSQFQLDNSSVWFYDISSVLDVEIEVVFNTPAITNWYAYTDSAARTIVDVSKTSNQQGVQYVIPTIPATDANDHPPNELLVKNITLAASGTILAAPGAGKRYRVFSVQMATVTGGVLATAFDATSGLWIGVVAGPGTSQATIPAQGYPMTANTALGYSLQAGAGSVASIVYYTIETI